MRKEVKYVLGGTGAVLLIAVLIALFSGGSDEEKIPTVEAKKCSFRVSVPTVGTLDAVRSHVIYSRVKGERGKIIYLVEDGSRVDAGDLLVRLDPSFFEEEVRRLTAELLEAEATVDAWKQDVEWEKSQGEKELKVAGFEKRIAELDLEKLEKGEGPLELARLEGAMLEAKQEYGDTTNYVGELRKLEERGYSNPTEITQAAAKEDENLKKYEAVRLQFESYRDHILPALLETARARVERAAMVLEQTGKSSGFQVGKAIASEKNAEGALTAARSSLEIARAELEKTTITAPIAGIAVLRDEFRNGEKRKPMVGDTVWQNQPLLDLPDLSSMVVKTLVREVDLHKVRKGLPVRVRVDAYPDTVFDGRVESIGILAEKRPELRSGEQYFGLTIALDGSDERLRPGMTARTEIISDDVGDALTVPLAALFDAAGRTVCYVDIRSSFEAREVLVGRRNEDLAEIRQGLEEDEWVALYPPEQSEIKKTTPLE